MMNPRKRKLSQTSNSHIPGSSLSGQDSAKKRKLSSHKPGDPGGVASNERGTAGSKRVLDEWFTIRSIVKEKRGKYLIEWADDPTTGQKFKPSWEPKVNANAEAIADWESKKRTKAPAKKVKDAIPQESSSPAAGTSKSPRRPRRRRHRNWVVETSPSESSAQAPRQSSPVTKLDALEVQDSQQSQTLPAEPDFLAVQVSQHSSFDRDQYVQYLASSSAQELSSSQLQHHDSGLGSSSPVQGGIVLEEGIVPDSQSLPGSSRYITTSSKSIGISTDQSGCRSNGVDDETLSIVLASTSPVGISDPIASPSPPSGPQATKDNHQPSAAASNYPLRAPETSSSEQEEQKGCAEGSGIASPGGALQEESGVVKPESPLFVPLAGGVSDVRIAQLHFVEEIESPPAALDIAQTQSEGSQHTEDKSSHSLVLGSDELSSADQISPQRSGTGSVLVGEVWQSGQIVFEVTHCTSQSSSKSQAETLFARPQPEGDNPLDDASEAPQSADQAQAVLEHFTTSQNCEKVENPPRDSDLSVLCQRDPNSPSTKFNLEAQKDVVVESIEPGSQDLSSSQIPPAPSQLPETFDSYEPNPHHTLSTENDTMAEMPGPFNGVQGASRHNVALSPVGTPANSLREKLRNMRANSAALSKIRAESPRSARSTKSPSIIPDRLTQASQEKEKADEKPLETSLRTRVTPAEAESTFHNSKLALPSEMSQHLGSSSTLGLPQLGKMEFAIPLRMNERVSYQYQQTVYNYHHVIEKFVQEDVDEHSSVVGEMRTMIERVNNITTHVDLDSDMAMTQQQVSATDEANWAETCSAKFQFLRHFIDHVRATDMHVVILASKGRLLDILETFLKAHRAMYVRPDTMQRSNPTAQGPLKFTLLASTDTSSIISSAGLVIGFDHSANAQNPQVAAVRAHMLNIGQLSPMIHLLVFNSAEHINRCLPSSLAGVQRLQALVSGVAQSRKKVGQLPLEIMGPGAAAEEVAALLAAGGLEDRCVLPPMPKLVDVDFGLSSSVAGSSTQEASQHSTVQDVAPSSLLLKRAMDDEEDDSTVTKKTRMTPVPDITHVSDSISQRSQPVLTNTEDLQNALKTTDERVQKTNAQHASREAELQHIIAATKQRLQEHIDALSDLQFRYESRCTDLHTLRAERDAAAAATAQAQRRCESQTADISKLKEQQRVLEMELKEARTALLSSTIPEMVTLEAAKAEARQLTAEKTQLEKKLASLTKDFEFTRQQYQLASTAAADTASALTQLQSEESALKLKASGEAARLRQLNMSNESQVHRDRVKQLETTLQERDELLRKKEEELRDLKRGRGLATRASSAPRSPRLGSRASSPVPGLLSSAGRGGSALRFG